MEPQVITPTIGRIVWYWPEGRITGQPFAGIVVYVHNERSVNVVVWNHSGTPGTAISCPLVQQGDELPNDRPFCAWMPYQLNQAKRHRNQEDMEKLGIA